MNLCILIISCGNPMYRAKVQAQRDTWRKDAEGIDIRVFLGRGAVKQNDDEIVLDCDDGYKGLPEKVRLAFAWALDNGYDYCLRIDDDTYVQVERLLNAVPVGHDYSGRLRGPSGKWKSPYASGFAYWLSAYAMKVRANATTSDAAEDRATGNILAAAHIACHHDDRFVVHLSKRNAVSGDEGPRRGNTIICSCEYEPDEMHEIHEEWLSSMSKGTVPKMPEGTPFDNICVFISTFLRDGMLFRCIDSVLQHMPGARMVIADDGMETKQKIKRYAELRRMGHTAFWMDFDSGFGAKRNAAIEHYDRPYTLIGSDDFIWDAASAQGVLKMIMVLKNSDPIIGVASGRVDGNAYEGNIIEEVREDGKIHLKLMRLQEPMRPFRLGVEATYTLCDMTVNYNLVRREVFDHVHWHEEFKIGGDHLLFYQQVMAAGYLTAYVHGVDVRSQGARAGDVDIQYSDARGRARLALPSLFKRMNWYKFTGLDGRVDTLESVQAWCDNYHRPPVSSDPQRAGRARAKKEQKLAIRDAKRARAAERKKQNAMNNELSDYYANPKMKLQPAAVRIEFSTKLKDLDARTQELTVQELLDMVITAQEAAATPGTKWLEHGFEPLGMPEHGKNGALPEPIELDPVTLMPLKP